LPPAVVELADDKGDQIGRHLHAVGKHDFLLAGSRQSSFADNTGIGERRELFIDDQRHLIDRFNRRFIPAGKRPPRVRRLELRRRQRLSCPSAPW
jgi:hypothetical protein